MNIPVALPKEQWNTVLQVLAQQPWHAVNLLILEIQRQAAGHEADQVHDEPNRAGPYAQAYPDRPNGGIAP